MFAISRLFIQMNKKNIPNKKMKLIMNTIILLNLCLFSVTCRFSQIISEGSGAAFTISSWFSSALSTFYTKSYYALDAVVSSSTTASGLTASSFYLSLGSQKCLMARSLPSCLSKVINAVTGLIYLVRFASIAFYIFSLI